MLVYPVVLSQRKFIHRDSVKYPIQERALQFGNGIYEVIRVYRGKYFLLSEHLERLFRSATAIKLNITITKKELTRLLYDLIKRNDMTEDAKVYLQVSRGSAPRDHVFPENVEPNMYAYIEKFPRNEDTLKNGVAVITQRDVRWENCYIKSLNLLPNVLAKQEAKEQGCYEALLHRNSTVTECTSANAFLVKDGKIYTHPATNLILNGCVRMRIIEYAKQLNIPVVEEPFTTGDIPEADEIFLSSTTSEITPIVTVDDIQINHGKPGSITVQLQKAYEIEANLLQNEQQFT